MSNEMPGKELSKVDMTLIRELTEKYIPEPPLESEAARIVASNLLGFIPLLLKHIDRITYERDMDYKDMKRFQRQFIEADHELRKLKGEDPGASIIIEGDPVE